MNVEHLLDAMGLLDDDLIQEAEQYRRPQPKRNYGVWLGWAASFAVVLVLGYGATHFGMGGGGAASSPAASSPAASMPDASAPSGELDNESGGGELGNLLPPMGPEGDPVSGDAESQEPDEPGGDPFDDIVEYFGMESGQVPAIMVDGTVYWYTSATTVMRPDGLDVRYSTSYTDGEPEEDGQINFPKENVRYIMLEDGKVGVNWNGSYEWKVFAPSDLP